MGLQLPVRPSLQLALLLLVLHGAAAAAVAATVIPLALKLAGWLLIALSWAFHTVRDALLRHPESWCEISLDQGNVAVQTCAGTGFSGQLAPATVVTAAFVILSVRPAGRRTTSSRVILRDALNPDAFRELCVHLKYAVAEPVQ